LTVYSNGGKGVQVGANVGVRVIVGVTVIVGLGVVVLESGVIPAISSGVGPGLKIKKTTTVPSVMNKASNPNAAGKFSVISGNLLARTSVVFFMPSGASNSVPQTRQRGADLFKRVPQTGHSFVFELFVSELIIFLD